MSEQAGTEPRDRGPIRLSPGGTRVRLWVTAIGLVALLAGTVVGSDDHFPFGPMVQFAFSVPSNSVIDDTWVEAVTSTGARVKVPLTPAGVGLRRAEIEGQLSRIVAEPRLLGALATAHHRLHPDEPTYRRIEVVTQRTRLQGGRPAEVTRSVVAGWDAP